MGRNVPYVVGFIAFLMPVQASITIMDTGKSFASRPETSLGHQLWKGSDYMGRLQFVHGNLQLCKSSQDPSRQFTITEPLDGLPVAIYAKAGGCTLEEKALVASTLLDPSNLVGYLIVDDDRNGRRKKKSTGPSLSSWFQFSDDHEDTDDFNANLLWTETEGDTDEDRGPLWEDVLAQVYMAPPLEYETKTMAPLGVRMTVVEDAATGHVTKPLFVAHEAGPAAVLDEPMGDSQLEPVDESEDDDQSHPMMVERFRVSNDENAWWNGSDEIQSDDFSGRRLQHDTNKINVAILHVSNRIGFEILDVLLKESSETERMGGPKILLNSRGPPTSAGTIFVWTMLSVTMFACACCCMLVFSEFVGEDERNVPTQPTRRQLTITQVRQNFPSFLYHPDNHVEQPLDDECAICLDDFTEGMHLRKLPCGHVFHASCVARWLIERHAVCPLCKMDLFEEEDDPEVDHAQVAELRERYGTLTSITRWLSTSGSVTTAGTTQLPSSGTRWLWWSGTSTSPAATDAPAAPVPPAGAFRWAFTRLPVEDDATAAATPARPSLHLWQSASQWFGQGRRRGTEVRGMLTELTEPLLVLNNVDEAGPVSSATVASGGVTEVALGEGDTSSNSPAEMESSPSSPVEV